MRTARVQPQGSQKLEAAVGKDDKQPGIPHGQSCVCAQVAGGQCCPLGPRDPIHAGNGADKSCLACDSSLLPVSKAPKLTGCHARPCVD